MSKTHEHCTRKHSLPPKNINFQPTFGWQELCYPLHQLGDQIIQYIYSSTSPLIYGESRWFAWLRYSCYAYECQSALINSIRSRNSEVMDNLKNKGTRKMPGLCFVVHSTEGKATSQTIAYIVRVHPELLEDCVRTRRGIRIQNKSRLMRSYCWGDGKHWRFSGAGVRKI